MIWLQTDYQAVPFFCLQISIYITQNYVLRGAKNSNGLRNHWSQKFHDKLEFQRVTFLTKFLINKGTEFLIN